jgi:biopolymer transport protein ExbB
VQRAWQERKNVTPPEERPATQTLLTVLGLLQQDGMVQNRTVENINRNGRIVGERDSYPPGKNHTADTSKTRSRSIRGKMSKLWHHYQAGGWAMWIILFWLVCSIIAERAVYLYGASINKEVFLATMQKCILAGDVAKAVKMASAANAPLARIVQSGLVKVNRPDEEVQAAMDEAALREMPKINRRTGYLALFANLAMLSGLFGTIVGLIKAFGAVGGESVDPSQKARILAEGIAEAMNCTAFGLLSAIVALVGFAFLNGKTQALEDDINEASVQVLNLVVANRQKVSLQGLEQAAA